MIDMNRTFCSLIVPVLLLLACGSADAKDYSVNRKGIMFYSLENKHESRFLQAPSAGTTLLSDQTCLWRLSSVDDEYFYLDAVDMEKTAKPRLRATSYLPMTLTTNGIEGMNWDVQWSFVPAGKNGEWGYILHRSSGKYLKSADGKASVSDLRKEDAHFLWKMIPEKLNLEDLESPILMMGDDHAGFRDPSVIYHEGQFYMYYSYVLTEEEEKIYWYLGMSRSRDLVHWSEPLIITEKDQNKNFASPGGVVRIGDEWVIPVQTYVIPGYTRKQKLRFGNDDCRVWILRSKDLIHWSEPEKLYVEGPGIEPRHMIDAHLVQDKDEQGKWWCFYKASGQGECYSWTKDLKTWHPYGRVSAGENVCVWVENGKYYMMYSPSDGMGILQSEDLKEWTEFTAPDNLGREDWEWAGQRATAGFVLDLRDLPAVGKYLLFFHGQGPAPKNTEIINSGTDLGIAWGEDLKTWNWPGK